MLKEIVEILDEVIATGGEAIYYDADRFGHDDPVAAQVEKHQASLRGAHSLRERLRSVEGSTLFLYRALEVDGDLDPLDHGVARADSIEELRNHLEGRFRELGFEDPVEVRVYPVADPFGSGILDTEEFADLTIEAGPAEE